MREASEPAVRTHGPLIHVGCKPAHLHSPSFSPGSAEATRQTVSEFLLKFIRTVVVTCACLLISSILITIRNLVWCVLGASYSDPCLYLFLPKSLRGRSLKGPELTFLL